MMPNPFFDKHSNPLVSGTSSVRGSKEKSKEKKKDKKSVDATKSSESKSVGSKLTNLFSFSKVNVTQSQTEQSIPQGNDNNKTSDTIPLKHNDSDQPVAPEIPHMPEPRSSQLVFESAEAVQHHSSQHEDSEIDISYRYDVDPFTGIPNRFKKGSRSATTSTKSRNKHIKEAEEALFARQHGKYQAPEDIPLDKLEQFLRDHPHVMDGSKRRSLSQSSEREHQESEPKDRLRYKMIIADAAKYFLHEEKGEIILEYVTTVQEIVDAFVVNHMNAHVIKWTDYVGAYMKGQYNICSPPNPPMMHHTVRYLPALSPPNEVERNTCLAKLYATWPKAQTCAATKIVAEARTEFSATGVCFSLIDSTHELIKAESGFVTTSGNIPRAASMAAHVLLTSDVLVVLDARKDWRFRKHPIVVNAPHVRFFAGAPLMTCHGTILGVIWLFGKQPRVIFTPHQRRYLAELASRAMNSVIEPFRMDYQNESNEKNENFVRWTIGPDDHKSGLSQTGPGQHVSQPAEMSDGMKQAGHMRKHSAMSEVIMNQGEHEIHPSEMFNMMGHGRHIRQPYENSKFEGKRVQSEGCRRNPNNLALSSNYNDLLADWPPVPISPRAFSSSDLTSIESRRHPNTPARGLYPDISLQGYSDIITEDNSSSFVHKVQEEADFDVTDLPAARIDSSFHNMSLGSHRSAGNKSGGRLMSHKNSPQPQIAPASPKPASFESLETQETFEATNEKLQTMESARTSLSARDSAVLHNVIRDQLARCAASTHFDTLYLAEVPPLPGTPHPILEKKDYIIELGSYGLIEGKSLDYHIEIFLHYIFLDRNKGFQISHTTNSAERPITTMMVRIAAKPFPEFQNFCAGKHHGILLCALRNDHDGLPATELDEWDQQRLMKCADTCTRILAHIGGSLPLPDEKVISEPTPTKIDPQSILYQYTDEGVFHPTKEDEFRQMLAEFGLTEEDYAKMVREDRAKLAAEDERLAKQKIAAEEEALALAKLTIAAEEETVAKPVTPPKPKLQGSKIPRFIPVQPLPRSYSDIPRLNTAPQTFKPKKAEGNAGAMRGPTDKRKEPEIYKLGGVGGPTDQFGNPTWTDDDYEDL